MPYELPPDPRTERRQRLTHWLAFAFAAALVVLVTYFGYVGYEGSRQLVGGSPATIDCRTPATLGWEYEAVNYDIAEDRPTNGSDPETCTRQAPPAGDALVTSDGVPIAGWYVPAGDGAGPTSPTVVLAHGWTSTKSGMLSRAELLHAEYNLVLFDFRNHGQSGRTETTQGVRETDDLRAVIDWLVETKGPDRIGVFGVSMGGVPALRHSARDERVDAVVVESTHATITSAAQARIDLAGYPLSVPGSWAVLLGALLRTGEDITVADPIGSVARLDGRPLLLVSAGADDSLGPGDGGDLLAAAEEGGSPVTLHVCPNAGHGGSPDACPEQYPGWVLGFLERHLVPPG